MAKGDISSSDKERAESMCVCKACPTYFDCDEPLAFCFYHEGTSSCITVKHGCICSGCPVFAESGLKFSYYCIAGSEKAQENR